MFGLGSAQTTNQITQGISYAGTAAGVAAGAGLLTGIGITAAAVPFIGPVIAGVALAVSALHIGQGCGGTCTASTQIVNQVEPLLQQNLAAAQQTVQAQGCLTQDEAIQLENNFNALWDKVVQSCNQIGPPGGKQCVDDRQPGGKYDWTSYYLTPIKNMPVCPGTASGLVTSTSSGMTIPAGILVPVALIALALLMGGKS